MISTREKLFARIAVQRGYVLKFQIDSAMQTLEESRNGEAAIRLESLLVERGYMIEDHVRSVQVIIAAYNIHCQKCRQKYNVFGLKVGDRFKCRGCQGIVAVPAVTEPQDSGGGPRGSYVDLEPVRENDSQVLAFEGRGSAHDTDEVDLDDALNQKLKPKAELIADEDDGTLWSLGPGATP